MTDPSVAVIIANHNRDDTLRRAIHSALEQDYGGVVRVYVAYRPRPGVDNVLASLPSDVTAIAVEDVPGSNSISLKRNAALHAGAEELVAFLDDDDVWHPQKIALQVEALARHCAAVAACTRFTEWGGGWPVMDDTALQVLAPNEVIGARVVAASSVVVRRSALVGMEFDERAATFAVEDYDLWLRLLSAGDFVLIPHVLTALGPTPASASTRDRRAQHARTLLVLNEHCRVGRLPRPAVRTAARRSLAQLALARPAPSTDADGLLDAAVTECLFGALAPVARRAVRVVWRHDETLEWLHKRRDASRRRRGMRRR